MYFNGLFNLDEWKDDVRYIVLDDIDIDFFPQYKSFFGAQKQFTLTDKYRKKKQVKWGKPCIWTNNNDPRDGKLVDRNWMDLNIVFIRITNKLY